MKKLFLLAMLSVFQLSTLMAQAPVLIGTKPSDDGIKRELYKIGTATRIKYVFEDGGFFWEKENKEGGWLIDKKLPYRLTYNNGVVERKDDGMIYVNLLDGNSFVSTRNDTPAVYLTAEGHDLEKAEKNGAFIYDKGKRVTHPDYSIGFDIITARIKVDDGKYEYYEAKDKEHLSLGLIRKGDTHNFTFAYNSNDEMEQILQTLSKTYEVKELSEELKQRSLAERISKFGVNYEKEVESYYSKIVPNNLQKDYIISMVEGGRGGVVGLDGLTYKELKKMMKSNAIDFDAVAKNYEYTLDSIQKSWIVTRQEKMTFTYPVDRNDTIVSFSVKQVDTNFEINSKEVTNWWVNRLGDDFLEFLVGIDLNKISINDNLVSMICNGLDDSLDSHERLKFAKEFNDALQKIVFDQNWLNEVQRKIDSNQKLNETEEFNVRLIKLRQSILGWDIPSLGDPEYYTYHTLHYKNGDSIVAHSRSKSQDIDDYEEMSRFSSDIVSGVLTKDNGKLIINSKEDIVLELNNGDKFFTNNLEYGIKGNPLFEHKITPWKGTLSKADGTAEEMKEGYTESQRIAMQKAEEERKTKMAAEARAELCAKYGEKYVKAYEEGEFVKGMPDVLVNEVCKKGGMVLKSPKRWSDGTTRYEVHFPFNTILGQGTWIGYIYMDNGRLSWWRIDL